MMTNEFSLMQQYVQHPVLQQCIPVLQNLEARGLQTPYIGGGCTRNILFDMEPKDIDIHFVGDVPSTLAEQWLSEILAQHDLAGDWDIWNFQEHEPQLTSTLVGYYANFVSTIDCIYLSSDGQLHDLTGRGMYDVQHHLMDLCHLYLDFHIDDARACYLCLESCRRMYLHWLTPTPRTAKFLRVYSHVWRNLTEHEKEYFYKRFNKKLTAQQQIEAKPIYERYGWDFIYYKV